MVEWRLAVLMSLVLICFVLYRVRRSILVNSFGRTVPVVVAAVFVTASFMGFDRRPLHDSLLSYRDFGIERVKLDVLREAVANPNSVLLEVVSEPPRDDQQACDLDEALVEIGVVLPAGHDPPEVVQPRPPSAGPLGLPPSVVAAECSPVLPLRAFAMPTMRTDQLDAASVQSNSELVAVGGSVVDQTVRNDVRQDGPIEQPFDQNHLVAGSRLGIDSVSTRY